jgi:protein-S-isoprenylcysteine O-methyltransferase Ste14
MALKDELERSGNVLFRWRSYPPILFFGVVLWGMRDFHYPRGSHVLAHLWEVFCIVPVLSGLALRMWAIGASGPKTSGGNRREQIAEEVNTTGAYSIVRHPLYLGILLIWTGVAMFPRSIGIVVVIWLLFWVYYERIMIAEESFLERKFGAVYKEWSDRTPAIMPSFSRYVKSRYKYSLAKALRREYSAWLAAAIPLFVLEQYGSYVMTGRLTFNRAWVIGIVVVIILSASVRALKHYTKVLQTR